MNKFTSAFPQSRLFALIVGFAVSTMASTARSAERYEDQAIEQLLCKSSHDVTEQGVHRYNFLVFGKIESHRSLKIDWTVMFGNQVKIRSSLWRPLSKVLILKSKETMEDAEAIALIKSGLATEIPFTGRQNLGLVVDGNQQGAIAFVRDRSVGDAEVIATISGGDQKGEDFENFYQCLTLPKALYFNLGLSLEKR